MRIVFCHITTFMYNFVIRIEIECLLFRHGPWLFVRSIMVISCWLVHLFFKQIIKIDFQNQQLNPISYNENFENPNRYSFRRQNIKFCNQKTCFLKLFSLDFDLLFQIILEEQQIFEPLRIDSILLRTLLQVSIKKPNIFSFTSAQKYKVSYRCQNFTQNLWVTTVLGNQQLFSWIPQRSQIQSLHLIIDETQSRNLSFGPKILNYMSQSRKISNPQCFSSLGLSSLGLSCFSSLGLSCFSSLCLSSLGLSCFSSLCPLSSLWALSSLGLSCLSPPLAFLSLSDILYLDLYYNIMIPVEGSRFILE